jgi:hypothetical protein
MVNIAHNESIALDLSNESNNPTLITLIPGSNLVIGTTVGGGNPPGDRDFFRFVVPANHQVEAIILNSYQWGDGDQTAITYGNSYFAVNQGANIPDIMSGDSFLISALIDDSSNPDSEIGTDLLILGNTSSSNPGPGTLESGSDYTIWYQETGANTTYEFDIQLVATNVIPTLTITPIQGTEADGTQFTITVTTNSPVIGTQTVDLNLSGDAVPADFTVAIPNQITIPDGQTSGSVSVTVNDDAVDESEIETATFTISNASAGITLVAPISQNVTIADYFDSAQYGASYDDLMMAFRNLPSYADKLTAFEQHYFNIGRFEGRGVDNFNELRYVASNPDDLIGAFGTDGAAATEHYINYGFFEGRLPNAFDPARYLVSYGDLLAGLGRDLHAATVHFITDGYEENRDPDAFFPTDRYIATHADLIEAFGYNLEAGSNHYLFSGILESRRVLFDPQAYLNRYGDLQAAFGNDLGMATRHYIELGFDEGRSWM